MTDTLEMKSMEKAKLETEYLNWVPQAGFFRPDYHRSLTGIVPTMLELLGSPVAGFPSLLSFLPSGVPRRARRVFLLCLDGFGFREMGWGSRFQALYQDYGAWVTSVFPTITSCAMTSIYQGLAPARHGILGHNIWKDSPGAVVDMLKMHVVGAQAPLAASGFDLTQWRKEQGVLERNGDSIPPGKHLMPYPIINSGLSTYIYGDAERVGFVDLVEGISKAGRMLSDLDTGWVSLYSPVVDTVGHVLTGEAPEMALVVRQVEECVRWLAGSLPEAVAEETLLMVFADHGQSPIRERIPLHGEPMEWLKAHTRAVGFSGRVMHLYLGGKPEQPLREGLTALVGDKGMVCGFDEVKALAGDAADEGWVRQSLGDLVVMLREGYNWESRAPEPGESPYASRLLSQHGSLCWDEMIVPLLAAPLAAVLKTD